MVIATNEVTEIKAFDADLKKISLVDEKLNNPTKVINSVNFASLKLGNFFAIFNTISTIIYR